MPLYDFRCRRCHEEFEALVRPASAPSCPACGSDDLEQLLSTFAVSSDTIRRSNLTAVRRRAAKARTEKLQGDHAEMKKHIDEHH